MIKDLIILTVITIIAVTGIIFLIPIHNAIALIDSYWVITVVAFFGALIANATAIGGGIIFVPVFIHGFGLSSLSALKLSLASQSFGMSSGAFSWGRKLIDKTGFIIGGSASLIGVCLGTYVWNVPPEFVKPVFGYISVFIILALIAETRYGNYGIIKSKIDYKGMDIKLTGLFMIGIIGGFITSWIAIGVGEFIALYLLFMYRIKIENAVATGVAVLAIDSILGFMLHTNLGHIPWELLLFSVPGVIFGGFAGGKLGKYMDKHPLMLLNKKNHRAFHKISPLRWFIIIVIAIDTGIMLLL